MKFLIMLSLVLCSPFTVQADYKDKTNGEYVTVSGTVDNVSAHSFTLKSKGRNIFVEMDDYDWDADGYKLINGDNVVVMGRIDNDFLEKKKIEAGTAYVKGIDSFFFANSADEEGPNPVNIDYSGLKYIPEDTHAHVSGIVTAVDGREMVVDTGLRKLTVDTSQLIYNPLDKVGSTKIAVGDFVKISGEVDKDFFGNKELDANYVIEM